MITGTPHPEGEDWGGYESTHIWPLAREGTWNATPQLHGWITDTAPAAEIGGSRLFSPQNGILMKSDLHTRFIVYKFSINPDVSPFRFLRYHSLRLTDWWTGRLQGYLLWPGCRAYWRSQAPAECAGSRQPTAPGQRRAFTVAFSPGRAEEHEGGAGCVA